MPNISFKFLLVLQIWPVAYLGTRGGGCPPPPVFEILECHLTVLIDPLFNNLSTN